MFETADVWTEVDFQVLQGASTVSRAKELHCGRAGEGAGATWKMDMRGFSRMNIWKMWGIISWGISLELAG